MIRKLLLSITTSIVAFQAMSCDVCGCSLSGLYFGFIPVQNTHFVGVKYSAAHFDAFIDNDDYYFEDEYSEDTYQRFDIMGRFSLGKRLQLRFMVPYLYNIMDGSHQNVRSYGIGDPVMLAYYSVLNSDANTMSDVNHSLNLGAGVKLPVGEYNKTDQEEIINRNFQLGSGSIDYLLTTNYTVRHQKMGMNAEVSYKLNTPNKHEYRFGNQLNASVNVFRYFELDMLSIVPFLGGYFETAAYHYFNDIKEANTGGYSWLGTLGVQIFTGDLTFNAQYQIPVKQQFNTDEFATIEVGNRLNLAMYFSFSSGK